MEVKKSSTFDLRKNSLIYILLGLNVVLGMILLSFSSITKDVERPDEEVDEEVVYTDDIEILDTDNTPPPPPPPPEDTPPPPPPPDVVEEIEEAPEEEEPPKVEEKVEREVTNAKQVYKASKPSVYKPPPPPPPPPPPKEEEVVRKKTVSAREVEVMAVYPGCEKDRAVKKARSTGDKKAEKEALRKCFSKKLNEEITYNLDEDELSEYAEDESKNLLVTKLSFIVDTKGRITSIKAASKGDKKLSPEAVKALKTIAKKLAKKGGMTPGKYADGEPVNMTYNIPVKFKFENN